MGQTQTRIEVSKLDLLTCRRAVAVVVESAGGVVVNNEVVEIGKKSADSVPIAASLVKIEFSGLDLHLQPRSSDTLGR